MASFDPESVDLSVVALELRRTQGARVPGLIVGKTLLRDEVARTLGCSLLEAECVVDTMVGRGFLVRARDDEGEEGWAIVGSPERPG